MNRNEKFVITINRELGSGGRTVGELLAKRLGVPLYDKALIQGLQDKYNLSVDEIERLKGRSHSWWSEFKRAMTIGLTTTQNYVQHGIVEEPDLLVTDDIYESEVEILKGIAESESCVITGRTAFHVLRRHPNHVSILIQAPIDQRIARLVRKRGISQEDALDIIERVDKERENYVKRYTGTSRYDTRNYDLVISIAEHTEDEVVELIMNYIEHH
jgi:cytidylate kinase